ncbi:UDPGT domain-containing protein [Cephalotus follicularis]|uniref:Glycosyltransferase n=1 Tax=Cephalotus follicularis TaxID=3775 RepID=A0A1Q3ASQ1_CEPFO|nr:UDPGT domain-containing protein [Cephalotus follicularis]
MLSLSSSSSTKSKMYAEPTTFCHVLALPYPRRGHINPMMNLCNSLTSKKPDIFITFVVTEEWLGFIGSEPNPNNVRFDTIPNVFTSELASETTNSGSFFQEVSSKMEAPVDKLVDRLELPVTTIIADTYINWAVDFGNRRNIPVASFWTMSASVYSVFHHFDLLVQNGHFPVNSKEQGNEVVDYIPGVSSTRIKDLATCIYGKGQEALHRAIETISLVSKAQYLLLTSVYELDDKVIDALKEEMSLPIYHIGPTIPYFKLENSSSISPMDISYAEWLDVQPKGSVLYVSQGSLHSSSNAQLEEIAAGLRNSGVRYLWVARKEATRFQEDCGDNGLVVPWCDQLRMLCHSSIGGFLSHCGWNSTSEAILAGIPMLTFPLYWDQVPDAKVIVEDWKIGWRAKNNEIGEENLVTREEIADIVRRFMDFENEDVKDMRRRVRDLREICLAAIQKGGSSDTDLDAFITDISQCHHI